VVKSSWPLTSLEPKTGGKTDRGGNKLGQLRVLTCALELQFQEYQAPPAGGFPLG